jgi:hypothetical protein
MLEAMPDAKAYANSNTLLPLYFKEKEQYIDGILMPIRKKG